MGNLTCRPIKLVPLRTEKTFKRRVWVRLYSFEYFILFSDPELTVNIKRKRKDSVISSFNKTTYKKTDINPNGVQMMKTCLEYMDLNI